MIDIQTACCAQYVGTEHEEAATKIHDLVRAHYEAHPVKCATGRNAARDIERAQSDCREAVTEQAQKCGFAIETLTLLGMVVNIVRIFYQWISNRQSN